MKVYNKTKYLILIFLGATSLILLRPNSLNKLIPKNMQKTILHYSVKHYTNSVNPQFSFDYPEFEGWKTQALGNQITYTPQSELGLQLEYAPNIAINTLLIDGLLSLNTTPNPNGINYGFRPVKPESKNFTVLMFDLGDQYAEISLPANAVYPNFSGQVILTTIISSFNKKE